MVGRAQRRRTGRGEWLWQVLFGCVAFVAGLGVLDATGSILLALGAVLAACLVLAAVQLAWRRTRTRRR